MKFDDRLTGIQNRISQSMNCSKILCLTRQTMPAPLYEVGFNQWQNILIDITNMHKCHETEATQEDTVHDISCLMGKKDTSKMSAVKMMASFCSSRGKYAKSETLDTESCHVGLDSSLTMSTLRAVTTCLGKSDKVKEAREVTRQQAKWQQQVW